LGDRIKVDGDHDNGDRTRRLPSSPQCRLSARDNEHVEIKLDERGCQVREPLSFPLSSAELEDEVLAFHVPKFPQSPLESDPLDRRAGGATQHADPGDFRRWLRRSTERHPEETESDHEPDQSHGHLGVKWLAGV